MAQVCNNRFQTTALISIILWYRILWQALSSNGGFRHDQFFSIVTLHFIWWSTFYVLYWKIDLNGGVLETFSLLSVNTSCPLCCCARNNSLTMTLYITRHDSNISHSWGINDPACVDPDASHFFHHILSGTCSLSSGSVPPPFRIPHPYFHQAPHPVYRNICLFIFLFVIYLTTLPVTQNT
jgi:hypothetical protein